MSNQVEIHVCQTESERDAAFAVRRTVFVGEQGVPEAEEIDEYDTDALHLLAIGDGGEPLGTARVIRKTGNLAKIGRVAVLKAVRENGLGRRLMQAALDAAIARGMVAAVLDAQSYAIPFYEKLGFVADGGVFDDCAIPHRRMNKELTTMTGFERLRAAFPSAEKSLHLNHAGTAPAPTVCRDAVNLVMDEMMSADSFTTYAHHMKREANLRGIFARMLHTKPETLAITRNTSHGITIMAQAIPFTAGQNVVVARSEYPANLYPWMAQAQRSVTVKMADAQANGLVEESALMALCDSQTKVLAVSSVQWGTGQRMNLQKLGDFCRAKGILLCVDIVQGFGQMEYRIEELPVDMAAAGCHKWLVAPGGVGVLYVRDGLMPQLLNTNIGWNSVADSVQWEKLQFDTLKPTPARFEEGTPNLLGVAALEASLSLVESVGFTQVYARIQSLADTLTVALHTRGMHLMSPSEPSRRSGIVAFRHPTLPNETVHAALTEKGILCAVRCGNIRFSPYAYQTDAEMQAAVDAIPV